MKMTVIQKRVIASIVPTLLCSQASAWWGTYNWGTKPFKVLSEILILLIVFGVAVPVHAVTVDGIVRTVSPVDSLAAIQGAVDDAQAVGGEVFFTAGTYDFGSGRLEVRNSGDVTLTADEPDDPLNPATYNVTLTSSGFEVIKVQCRDTTSNVTVENLSVVGADSAIRHRDETNKKGGNLFVESCSLQAQSGSSGALHSTDVGAVSLCVEKCLIRGACEGILARNNGEWTDFTVKECKVEGASGGIVLHNWERSGIRILVENNDVEALGESEFNATALFIVGPRANEPEILNILDNHCLNGRNVIFSRIALIAGNVMESELAQMVLLARFGTSFQITDNTFLFKPTKQNVGGRNRNAAVILRESTDTLFEDNHVIVAATGDGRTFRDAACLSLISAENTEIVDNLFEAVEVQIRPAIKSRRNSKDNQFIDNAFTGTFSEALLGVEMTGSLLVDNHVENLTPSSGFDFVLEADSPAVGGAGNTILGNGIENVWDQTDNAATPAYDGRNTIVDVASIKNVTVPLP